MVLRQMYDKRTTAINAKDYDMNILHIDSSILDGHLVSRKLTAEVVESIRLGETAVNVVYRDVTRQLHVPFSDPFWGSKDTPAEAIGIKQAEHVVFADAVMAEFLAADILVIGAPMCDFSVPRDLKVWIDTIIVAGITFKYGQNGPEGCVTGKRAIIVATGGVQHQDNAIKMAHTDTLRMVLGFLGINDVCVISEEGLGMSPVARDPSTATVRANLSSIM